jgi:transposase
VADLIEFLEKEKPNRLPKGRAGKAINYFLKNKDALQLFLKDPKIPLDNNISERHLRLIALGRKNYLFVGHDHAGENLAVLQTLVATCVANEVDPQKYLTDVLIRIQTHPQSRLDDLLPNNWKPPDSGIAMESPIS